MRFIFLVLVVTLSACSSQPPQPSSYLLRSKATAPNGELAINNTVALGSVLVATYLEQPGLVLATGDGKVHSARYNVWAEPLQVSLRQYLASEISAGSSSTIDTTTSAATKTRINVMIDQLHGNGAGAAVIEAFWELVSADNTRSFKFSDTERLAGDGYDVLVKAEESLLQRLAAQIAASLK